MTIFSSQDVNPVESNGIEDVFVVFDSRRNLCVAAKKEYSKAYFEVSLSKFFDESFSDDRCDRKN